MNLQPGTSHKRAAESMGRIRQLHFVDIGGSGMNGIAQVMLNLGYRVSGSDLKMTTTVAMICCLKSQMKLMMQISCLLNPPETMRHDTTEMYWTMKMKTMDTIDSMLM